jgi:hypothetical protein
VERIDQRIGDQATPDKTSLKEFWMDVKQKHPKMEFAARMKTFERIMEEIDLYNYYDRTARQQLCEALDQAPRERRPFDPRPATQTVRTAIAKAMFSLTMVMPNGRSLGDCTGQELGQWGSQLFRLARAIGPDKKVGDVFDTDEKLHEFLG